MLPKRLAHTSPLGLIGRLRIVWLFPLSNTLHQPLSQNKVALMFKVFDKALFGCLPTNIFEADDARRAI